MQPGVKQFLVVEDEPLIYDVISDMLTARKDVVTHYAADGEAGLARLETAIPDLALIDVMLPKISGLRVAEAAAARGVPVVMMTGHPTVIAKGVDRRFPLLVKPFRISRLVERLDSLFAEAERLRQVAQAHIRTGATLVRKVEATRLDVPVDWQRASERWRRICEQIQPGEDE